MADHLISFNGNSMMPVLRDGDRLSYCAAPFADLKKYDIVFFTIPRSQQKAVHRIITIDYQKKHLHTKGDGSLIPDPFRLNESEIIGRIHSYTRQGKTVNLTPSLLFFSYLYSKFMHPYRKLKNIIKTQTIFRD
jgi:signal peptidase I